jgi:hypothetical protein
MAKKMSKYTVKFKIEAASLGDATNRALVALYKGDLDAEAVSVTPDSEKSTVDGEKSTESTAKFEYSTGGLVPKHPAPTTNRSALLIENTEKS